MKKYEIARKIEALFKEASGAKYGGKLQDTRIYFGGKTWCYMPQGGKGYTGKRTILTDINARDYCEYANEDTITCTFEGQVYECLNYGIDNYRLMNKLNDMLQEYGYYYEMGHAWNFSLYEV